ncbi:putative WD repeat-containing protein 75-like [Apostichopus japonicus]|uniref:Putative WD repeat-containing protein 75-like n=1 Tax=Stichopus japonicus TaxID=307972 RepID=A0A2G8L5V4_STIJA|nr:putative WD repeat-containing protein 75-like [Apostichopus japonicus]
MKCLTLLRCKKFRLPVVSLLVIFEGASTLTKYVLTITVDPAALEPTGILIKYFVTVKVRIYSVATGKCVQNLIGHSDVVTNVSCNPHNKLQATTCSLDGTVRRGTIDWSLADGLVDTFHPENLFVSFEEMIEGQTFTFPWPIYSMLVHETFPTDQFYLCKQGIETDGLQTCFTLMQTSAEGTKEDAEVIFSQLTGECEKLTVVSGNGEFIAGIDDNFLLLYFLKGKKRPTRFKAGSHPLTCLASHPTKSTVAVGNEAGHIIIITNLHRNIISNLEHWHANRVEDLCFSPEGVFLYSVGHECVLVDWNLEKGVKSFLPRLGAPINHVSCAASNALKAVCLLDNAILILSQNVIQQTIQGISRSKLYYPTSYIPCGLLLDPRTNALVKNGRKGHLHFYNIEDDTSLVSIDITGENYVSGNTLDNIRMYTDVVQAAFSMNGDWLATVEEQRAADIRDVQCRVKFWIFDKQKQSFLLNTTVERPHDADVNALEFQPWQKNREGNNPVAVTASLDGKFKVWRYGDNFNNYKKSKCWNCDCVGFYKDAVPSDVSFSSDGSLLSVSFNVTITLWEPDANVLTKTLCHTLSNLPIRKLEFGRGQSSHMLICATSDRITSWNMLSCQVQWSVQLACKLLISDPYSELMASVDSSNKLFVFQAGHSKPLFFMDCRNSIISATFVPRTKSSLGLKEDNLLPWQKHSQLYLMTEEEEIVAIVTKEEAELYNKKQRFQNNLEESLPSTPFAEFLQSHGNRAVASGKQQQTS